MKSKILFYFGLILSIIAIKITVLADIPPMPNYCINGLLERDCTPMVDNNGEDFLYCYRLSDDNCDKDYIVY